MKLVQALPLLLIAEAAAAAADWTLFQGPVGGVGDVVQVGPAGAVTAPEALDDVTLLPIDFVGRTRLERFLPDRPRHEELPGGAARLALPQAHGSLYAFRADRPGGTRFGLFVVEGGGAVRVLLDEAGVGPAGDTQPFAPRVASAPDGAAILVATTLEAGGNLLEIDVTSGAIEDRTALQPPFDFTLDGLGLRATWGVALTTAGPFRFQRSPGAALEAVPFGPDDPAWFGGQVVFSGDGLVAGLLAGDGPDLARVATIGPAGPGQLAPMPLRALDGAGFLPEAADGPWLALSDDGSQAGYRTREPKPLGGVTREVWLTPTASGAPAAHLTADANFIDTIDEVGLLRFVPGAGLMFAAGEPNDGLPVGLDQIDLYLAQPVESGGTTIVNVTQSSGDPIAPFTAPASLSPEDGLYLVPGTNSIVMHDGNGGGGQLLGVEPTPGSVVVLQSNTKSLDAAAWTGTHLVLSVRRDLEPKRQELVAVAPGVGVTTLASFPEGTDLTGLAAGPTGTVGLVIRLALSQWVARVDPATGSGALLVTQPAQWQLPLAWTPEGSLRSTLAPALVPGLHVDWQADGAIGVAPSPATAGLLLPAL